MKDRKGRLWTLLLVLAMLCSVSLGASADDKKKNNFKETSLAGFVYNAGGGNDNATTAQYGYDGVAGAQVKLTRGDTVTNTVTDAKGYYQFDDMPEGDYEVTFSKDTFVPVTKSVHITKGGAMAPKMNVSLRPHDASMIGDTVIGPGTVYIAYAERQGSQATNVDQGMRLNTAQTMRSALVAGADPMAISGNVPAEQRGPDQQSNPTSTDPNSIMILPPNNLAKATFTPLSSKPTWLAFNKNGSQLFVSTPSQMIMIYDSAHGNRLLRNLPTQGAVTDLNLSLDGQYIAAGIMAANSGVMLIDARTGDPGAYLPCPAPPRSVAMIGKFVFACTGDSASGQVIVLDAGSARKVASIKVGNQPTGIALSPNQRHLFCVNSGSASLSVIDLSSMTEITKIPVGINPQKVAVSPDGSRVFVTNKQNNTVSVIDGKALGVIATTPVSAGPVGVTVSKDGSKAFVACKDAGSIVILNGKDGSISQTTIPMPNSSPWGVAVKP